MKTLDNFAEIRYNIIKESIPIGGRSRIKNAIEIVALLGSGAAIFFYYYEKSCKVMTYILREEFPFGLNCSMLRNLPL